MANDQFAFLKAAKAPTREQWQTAITDAGFDFELDPELKPREDSGFAPCKLAGSDTGVEIYFEDSPDSLAPLAPIAPDRDCYLSFRWGGDMSQCACARVASFALAERFGAIISYEGDEPYESLEQLKQDVDAVVADALKGTEPRAAVWRRRPRWIIELSAWGPLPRAAAN